MRRYGLSFRRSESIVLETARSIADGNVVAWFQGRMEFGQRALGNRSILADPRDHAMKDRLNAAVKYREGFRPFAPSILAEDVRDYFDVGPNCSVPFMERVCKVREEKRSLIPAVVHEDGTGRVQTVERQNNPRFYDLLAEFKRITGIPVLVNTSFNVKGEPIVRAPSDAVRTFYTSGLDQLVMGDFVVEKS